MLVGAPRARLLFGGRQPRRPGGVDVLSRGRRELVRAAGKLERLFPIYRLYGGRWAGRGIETRYDNAEVHKAAFALPRYVAGALEGC